MINLTADFGSMVQGLAVSQAYMSIDGNIEYWDAVIAYAFQEADNEFNTSAAAYGQTGAIKHMFEWGTLGINRQATNMRAQPTEERARLWKAFILNNGPKGGVWADFEYKPSIANVPVSTSVPQAIRAMMRKHQFTWKARVMEEGEPVTISRQEAQFLLIPYRPGMTGFRPSDIARGYTLTKGPIEAVPGRRVEGTFTAFWTRYWGSRGIQKLQAVLEAEIEEDYVPYFAETGAAKPISGDVVAAVERRSREIQMEVAAKAKARRANVK